MSENTTETTDRWPEAIETGLLSDTVTVATPTGTHEVKTYRDDVMVRLGIQHPELREALVKMFERCEWHTMSRRYPRDIGELLDRKLGPEHLDALVGIIDNLPDGDHKDIDKATEVVRHVTDPDVADVLDPSNDNV